MHMLWEIYIPSCKKDGFKTLTVACNEFELENIVRLLMERYEKAITTKKVTIRH